MRAKYLEESVGYWLPFGTHKDGRVDIMSEPFGRDIATVENLEQAERVCKAFNDLVYAVGNNITYEQYETILKDIKK